MSSCHGNTPAPADRRGGTDTLPAELRVILVGGPNVGKSTLFNALTGARQRTTNAPGTTVELATGTWRNTQDGSAGTGSERAIVDLPGTYSLGNAHPSPSSQRLQAIRQKVRRPAEGDDGSMDIELLVVSDCPNEAPAVTLLRTALDEIGLSGVGIVTTVIDTWQEAVRRGFIGSPTFLIDGVDPFGEPGRAPALACRVYPHPTGLTGVPDLSELRQALTGPAATPEEESQN